MKVHLIILLLFSVNSNAMDCGSPPEETALKKSDVVFEGTVIERDPPQRKCGEKIAVFKVSKTIKGEVPATVKIFSNDACYQSGIYARLKESYKVFAMKNKDILILADFKVGNCTASKLLSKESLDP